MSVCMTWTDRNDEKRDRPIVQSMHIYSNFIFKTNLLVESIYRLLAKQIHASTKAKPTCVSWPLCFI